MVERRALLGLGTNMGDREANLRAAIEGVTGFGRVDGLSRVYESEPYGYVDQPPFLNMALVLHTSLDPRTLLAGIKDLEVRIGREPTHRMGPRIIDIDILFYDDIQLDGVELSIPHPGVMDRPFVIAPLLDLDIALAHPVSGELLAERMFALTDTMLVPLGPASDVLRLNDRNR